MAEVGEVFYTFVPQKPSKGAVSDYTKTGVQTIDDMTWTVPGNQYGTGTLRLGGKSIDAVDRTITGQTAMGDAISQIVITHAGVTSDNLKLNSVKVTVASDAAFSADVETVTLASGTDFTIAKNAEGTITLTPANDFWAKDSYYKFDFNITNANSTNYAWVLNKIEFYSYAAGGETPSTIKTLYCKVAQDWWKTDGAAVGVYAFADGDVKNAEWPGVRMTAVEGENDLWKADIDIAKYEKIIFTRVNASGDIADWGAKTADLEIPADKDLYTITSTEAVWGDPGVAGEWSVYGEEPVVVEPTLANGFYLIGKINGVEGWSATDLSADRKFEGNPENNAEFVLTATLAEGDEIKVVNVLNDAITAWYPAEGGNYVIDAAHAGEKDIYFRPALQGGEDWFGACIYIAANEEPQPAEVDFTKPFTLLFNGTGVSGSDNSNPYAAEVDAIFTAETKGYVASVETAEKVYAGRPIANDNSSLKFGSSSAKGTLAFTLAQEIEVDSIIVNATQYGKGAAEVTVNGVKFDLTAGNKVPTDCKITPEGKVSAITIAQTGSERIYLRYVTVYPKQGGEGPVVEPAKFYITGDSALVVNAGLDKAKAWNPDAIKSTETSYKLNLAAGDYKLKVTVDGTWETAKGFNDLTTTADGLTADGDGNICFTLTEAGEVNVHYESDAFFLNGNFYVAPVVVHYYFKNNWGGEEWTWKEITNEEGYYMLGPVAVGGEGVNFHTAMVDEGAPYITWAEIEAFDASYEPAVIGAGDSVVFFFDPEQVNTYTGANGLSAQITYKYVAPVEEIKYCEFATGHLKDPNFGDANGRILLTIQKIADSNNIRVAIKNNAAAGNTKAGLNYLWVNAEGATNNNATYGSREAEDVEEVSVIVEFNEAKESYNFVNIHWAYAGWGGEWAIDGLTVSAAELCEAGTPVVEVNYYMKNNWDAADWTWKAMTKDGETYKLENVVFGGTGVNYNTADSDEGSSWVALENIGGAAIAAKDTVTFVLDPTAGTVTATLIGKYVPGETPQPVEHTYTVAGNLTAAFGTAWAPANEANDMEMNDDGIYVWERTELTLPAGSIEFKVCEDHAWKVAYPAENYVLNILEAGIYTIWIHFDPANDNTVTAGATKTGDAIVTVDYYLVGSAKGWEAKAENIFTLNAEAGEGIEEYVIETTLEVGEGLKVLSSTGTWYPEGMGNEYVVDQNHAGATTIYFRPAGNAEWEAFGGYMYVVPTGTTGIDAVDANAPAVKVLRNGQIFIIKGDKTYNVMGAIVR